MDDLGVFIQIKQWNCIIQQIQEKSLIIKARRKKASSKKGLALAIAKHKDGEIADEDEALDKKTPTEFVSDLSNHKMTRLMKDKENGKRI